MDWRAQRGGERRGISDTPRDRSRKTHRATVVTVARVRRRRDTRSPCLLPPGLSSVSGGQLFDAHQCSQDKEGNHPFRYFVASRPEGIPAEVRPDRRAPDRQQNKYQDHCAEEGPPGDPSPSAGITLDTISWQKYPFLCCHGCPLCFRFPARISREGEGVTIG
jgi:hypothetical protein